MRLSHFRALTPICPVCRAHDGVDAAVAVHEVTDEAGGHILQGRLRCVRCTRDYPIIDGIPVLVAALRQWIQNNLDAIMERTDLHVSLTSLIGEGMGPGTLYDTRRSHLSSYGWGHWGDRAPEPAPGPGKPAGVVDALAAGLSQYQRSRSGVSGW